jgi:hypothetical protein
MSRIDFGNNRGENLSDPKYDKDAVNYRTLKKEISNASTSGGGGGTSGTSGNSGTSGTSGTGFNSISNPLDNRILTSLGTTNTANAENNLTFNGSELNLEGIFILSSSTSYNLTVGNNICSSFSSSLGNGAYFDYCLISGSTIRVGTIISSWNNANTEYTDISTKDLDGDTSLVSFYVDMLGGDIRLNASISSGIWTIKSGIRII